MTFPTHLLLPDTEKAKVLAWAESKNLRTDSDCCGTSDISVTLTASGIGDSFVFQYGPYRLIAFYEDSDGSWFQEEKEV